jgi:hypothetical protein
MKFITVSGSVYEVDSDNKRLRRLTGRTDPTPRLGKDGEWRKYAEMFPSPIEKGKQVLITWGEDVALLPDTVVDEGEHPLKITMTSPVVEVFDVPVEEAN